MENLLRAPNASCCGASGRPAARAWLARRSGGVLLASLAGLLALSGCNHPLARERLAERRRALAFTADALTWREKAGAQRLQRDVDYIAADIRGDARELDRDLRALGAYIEADIRRFQDRQDDYRRKLGEIFRGKPENLERNAIMLFY